MSVRAKAYYADGVRHLRVRYGSPSWVTAEWTFNNTSDPNRSFVRVSWKNRSVREWCPGHIHDWCALIVPERPEWPVQRSWYATGAPLANECPPIGDLDRWAELFKIARAVAAGRCPYGAMSDFIQEYIPAPYSVLGTDNPLSLVRALCPLPLAGVEGE